MIENVENSNEAQKPELGISDVMNSILFELDKLERLTAIDMEIKLAEADFNGYKLEIGKRIAIKDCINVVKKYCS